MTPDRWQQVKSVLADALEIAADDRAAFLARACAGNAALRAEVEALLNEQAQAQSFIEQPAFDQMNSFAELADTLPAETNDGATSALPQEQIGPYKIVRELAHGGMGAVYLAERDDQQYQQQVAIKLIKSGMSSDFVVRRFRAERQILAALVHPNIARLLDGGTTANGSPYLVMEYIKGVPIDEYCDTHKLSTRKRLKLFQQVCFAVQYAHQNLIVHRDLKPNNILVTNDGVPKLLDFGIAKLLANNETFAADETATGLRLMTPAYASPEQMRGEVISTASDVYALGIILYELLTGHAPYNLQNKSLPEVMKVVCEQEPARPSTAAQEGKKTEGGERKTSELRKSSFFLPHPSSLRGDLDNIVLMALRKEPSRRYASVEQLAADIHRHLEGLPVLAHKDTLSYRTTKFLRRNRLSAAATVLILLALAGGVTTTIIQRNRAIKRFGEVRKLANAVIFDYQSAIETLPGSTEIRARMIKDSLAYLDGLSSEAGDDPMLQSELGKAYEKIGDIQGNTNNSNLNDAAAMMRSYRRSMELREAVLKTAPRKRDWQSELSFAYEKMGDALAAQHDLKGALASYEKGLAIVTELAKTDPDRRRYLATMHQLIGNVLGFPGSANLGDTKAALEHYRQAYEISQSLFDLNPKEYKNRWSFVVMSRSYANLLNVVGEAPKALEILLAAEKVAKDWAQEAPNDTRVLDFLALTYNKLSDVLQDTNDLASALQYSRKNVALREQRAATDANDMKALRSVALAHFGLGDLLAVTKDQTGAEQSYQRALKISEEMAAANPTNSELRQQLADAYRQFADVLGKAGKHDESLRLVQKSTKIFAELAAADPNDNRASLSVADNYLAEGKLLSYQNKWNEALLAYQKALPMFEAGVKKEPENAVLTRAMANLCERIGDVYEQQKRLSEARDSYQRALDFWLGLKQRNALRSKDADKLETLPQKLKQSETAFRK